MALVANLHDAGAALAGHLGRLLQPPLGDVLAGPPIENAASASESIRVSLLWVTPQPTHRNDPWIVGTNGDSAPPPVTLSGFYLITAYGTTGAGEQIQAVNRLGQALQIIETAPDIELPLHAEGNHDPVPGDGRASVTVVPMAADLMEKVFTPLQMRHRPWALVEVGPIQLQRLVEPLPGPDVVVPGGIRLAGPAPTGRPAIRAVSPARLGAGRRLRLDTVEAADAAALRVGESTFTFADPAAAADEVAPPDERGRVFVTYPADGPDGDVGVVLRGPRGASDAVPLVVDASPVPALDAPDAPLAPGDDLTLTGGGLDAVQRIVLWPARGVSAPDEVIDVAPSAVTATSVTAPRAALDAAGLRAIDHRVAVRADPRRYSAFVVLEVAR